MFEAATPDPAALGWCDARRPWLGAGADEAHCSELNRLLIRSASNAYFPRVLTVISLPDRDGDLERAVDSAWDDLAVAEDLDDVRRELRKDRFRRAFAAFSPEQVFDELEKRRGKGSPRAQRSVKSVELETLLLPGALIGNNRPDSSFHAEELPRVEWDEPWMREVGRVLLVHRLREVSALVGFTRFESSAPDTEGELDMNVQRAAIAAEYRWVPAIENRGEGIFLALNTDAVARWTARAEVRARGRELETGFERWKHERKLPKAVCPEPAYVLLHSLAHLLICSVSLECGYPSSSIRERIYCGAGGYGILLYTGSPDAEGTLGGLVGVGRRIAEHVRAALELGRLCSNDPVCAHHDPSVAHEGQPLLGAACHGCLLISETSCEAFNQHLDRKLVIQTLERTGSEFFHLG